MPAQPKFPLGTRCTGRVFGHGEADKAHWGDDPPELSNAEATQTGELHGYSVTAHGQTYFKHIINGYDIDPETLKEA